MSKKHYACCQPVYSYPSYGGGMGCGCNYSNPWTLIILILVVLQFSKKKSHDCDDDDDDGGFFGGLIDNGILFIIALFLLVYCGCGKGIMGGC
ncbi:hypothetical protein SAMN05443428_11045 [Caloramator quimbayensis]|uniref:Uncharacterized protein n=1 Tax=Caloramator quimbayensis TaxID=1147123 RepID=A0A1T4XM56_9CLOT|nr:hypothetical protein [Caloramator quimbayensis]SKA90161.1 hypothetical protein SAMN05443428_11045 [Caloramator quimbayensis]